MNILECDTHKALFKHRDIGNGKTYKYCPVCEKEKYDRFFKDIPKIERGSFGGWVTSGADRAPVGPDVVEIGSGRGLRKVLCYDGPGKYLKVLDGNLYLLDIRKLEEFCLGESGEWWKVIKI